MTNQENIKPGKELEEARELLAPWKEPMTNEDWLTMSHPALLDLLAAQATVSKAEEGERCAKIIKEAIAAEKMNGFGASQLEKILKDFHSPLY